jgi:NADPH-dependent glutamate synthase beta subunit-like oxidoreductase/coenzyme F420-reducing hydrogenase delta subunit
MNMNSTLGLKPQEGPPCQLACPIFTEARAYIQLIAERKYDEAFAAIRKQNPLPGVCGRICTHPCETACKRGQVDEPIAIAALKRFPTDVSRKSPHKPAAPGEASGHKVAIVGSGPAGLSAAQDLALLGHAVTIFEALPALGGMLRVGVPAYRLPKNVLDEEIDAILELGVEAKTGIRIGEDVRLEGLFEQGYDAVFLAIGAHKDRKLGIPGENSLQGVASAVSFLRDVNEGKNPSAGRRVAVIGGGNTAVDSARSLRRMGSEVVHLVYRRSREEMPATQEEIEEAVHEGVKPTYLTSPVEILGADGNVCGLKCIRNELGDPDKSGRKSPKPVAGSEFVLDVEMIIAAIGQAPESSSFGSKLERSERGNRIAAKDPITLATSIPGVFAGGDAVTGPATAIKAIAAGQRAARAIDAYLRRESQSRSRVADPVDLEKVSSGVIERTRCFSRSGGEMLPAAERLRGFDEVTSAMSESRAIQEALRCLHCHLGARVDQEACVSCLTCVRVCPLGIPRASKMGEITINPVDCQACGMCAMECPVRAIDIGLHSGVDILEQMEQEMAGAQRSGPLVVSFFDLHGNFGLEDLENLRQNYPSLVPVTVFGLRRIDTHHVLKAFELGADAVLLAACPEERDPFPDMRDRIKGRVASVMALTDMLGLGGERVKICTMPEKGLIRDTDVDELLQKIKEIGSSPLRV